MKTIACMALLLALTFWTGSGRAESLWPFGNLGGPAQDLPKGETSYAITPDGWKIALTRFKPSPGTPARPYPVILCHGFGYNANFWMLDSRAHLPAYLAAQGYDVWVPSLRGSGKSTKWMFKMAEVGGEAAGLALGGNPKDDPLGAIFGAAKIIKGIGQAEMNNVSMDPRFSNWLYDDYVMKDVPTIIKAVKDKSGKKKVHWVGHSMGGNILLCYLTQQPKANNDIASIFTAGSQLTMAQGTVMRRQFENFQAQRLLELQGNAGDLATMKEASKETNNKMFFNLNNVDSRIVHELNERALDTPAMGVLGQYMNLSDTGRYASNDKKADYTGAAKNITAPAFFSAGKKDNFVNSDDIAFLVKNTGSAKKDSKLYGRAEGFSADYGHNDAFISAGAGQEIYPLVLQWIAVNDGSASGPAIKRASKALEY